MYVFYVTFNSFKSMIFTTAVFDDPEDWFGYNPSECRWMVPGTFKDTD